MTAVAMALLFAGALLIYAGITDANIPAAVQSILAGNSPKPAVKP